MTPPEQVVNVESIAYPGEFLVVDAGSPGQVHIEPDADETGAYWSAYVDGVEWEARGNTIDEAAAMLKDDISAALWLIRKTVAPSIAFQAETAFYEAVDIAVHDAYDQYGS